ncbi:hypothetical protein [Vibrio crassostreae]|uniref:hypothetical protein n=1 Tax=Vibrio crassostreae TaxID=246167 RepID=UPI001B31178A|nr:hypothetical protein [Vibrio crassostreae]
MIFPEVISRRLEDPRFVDAALLRLDTFLSENKIHNTAEQCLILFLEDYGFDVEPFSLELFGLLPQSLARLRQAIQSGPNFNIVVSNLNIKDSFRYKHSNVESYLALGVPSMDITRGYSPSEATFQIKEMVDRFASKLNLAHSLAKNLVGISLGFTSGNHMQQFANDLDKYFNIWQSFLGKMVLPTEYFKDFVNMHFLHPDFQNGVVKSYTAQSANHSVFATVPSLMSLIDDIVEHFVVSSEGPNEVCTNVYKSLYAQFFNKTHQQSHDDNFYSDLYRLCVVDKSSKLTNEDIRVGKLLLLRSIYVEAINYGVTSPLARKIMFQPDYLAAPIEAIAQRSHFFFHRYIANGTRLVVPESVTEHVQAVIKMGGSEYEQDIFDVLGVVPSPLKQYGAI